MNSSKPKKTYVVLCVSVDHHSDELKVHMLATWWFEIWLSLCRQNVDLSRHTNKFRQVLQDEFHIRQSTDGSNSFVVPTISTASLARGEERMLSALHLRYEHISHLHHPNIICCRLDTAKDSLKEQLSRTHQIQIVQVKHSKFTNGKHIEFGFQNR